MIAREVVDVDSTRSKILKVWPEVAAARPEGSSSSSVPPIDRAKLGAIIFADPSARKRLNQLLKWPIMKTTLLSLWRAYWAGAKCVIVDAPLLFEAGLDKLCHVTVTVFIEDVEDQIKRLMERDASLAKVQGRAPITHDEAKSRIDSQMSTEEKRKRATYEIDNSGTLPELEEMTDTLIKHVRKSHKPFLPRNSLVTYLVTLFFLFLMFLVYVFARERPKNTIMNGGK